MPDIKSYMKNLKKKNRKSKRKTARASIKRFNKNTAISYAILAVMLVVYSVFSFLTQEKIVNVQDYGDTVSVISVGQADAKLISSGGRFCLIDAGQSGTADVDLIDYLKASRIKEIDLLVITHFHDDHTNRALDVLDKFQVNKILIPNLSEKFTPTSIFFKDFLEKVEKKNIEISVAKKGDKYTIGNGEITVLMDTNNELDINGTSVATLFVQESFSFLNTGDGEKFYEKELMQQNLTPVTLFAAGHHGSKTSSALDLLKIIKPEFVAISAGEDNKFGHPHAQVLENIEKVNSKIDITYQTGSLLYSINTKELIDTTLEKE